MAQVNYAALLRAHRIQAEAHTLRVEATAIRQAAREACRRHNLVVDDVAEQFDRRNRALALGTWPYWAPASRDLLRVLVPSP